MHVFELVRSRLLAQDVQFSGEIAHELQELSHKAQTSVLS